MDCRIHRRVLAVRSADAACRLFVQDLWPRIQPAGKKLQPFTRNLRPHACGDHLWRRAVGARCAVNLQFASALEGTSHEHKSGRFNFSSMHHVYRLRTVMRFDDPVLVGILQKSRTPGGVALTMFMWSLGPRPMTKVLKTSALIGSALITIFQCMTLEGWTDVPGLAFLGFPFKGPRRLPGPVGASYL